MPATKPATCAITATPDEGSPVPATCGSAASSCSPNQYSSTSHAGTRNTLKKMMKMNSIEMRAPGNVTR